MTKAKANGIEIEYETFGSPEDPTLLLVMGLGAQLIAWPDAFCEQLASSGFYVIRYDNRDVGLSTKFDDAPVANASDTFAANASSGGTPAAYTLNEMADDAAGLLDALGRDNAHVVGASMGGMISQLIALCHGDRVLSLTSIMSHAGGTDAVQPTPEALEVLLTPRPSNRDEVIELAVKARRVIGGKGWPLDEQRIREDAARAYDRCYLPAGFLRQMAAIMASPSRVEALGDLKMPVLVLHGLDDTLVPPENGRRTAAAIPNATLVEIEGMGHDMPEGAWPQIVEAVVANTARAAAHA
jgi:pimeloyl-ACP methyl ester carboxylesterase